MQLKIRLFSLIAAIIFFSLSPILYAQNFKGQTQDLSISSPQKQLTIGETLIYSVEWLGFPVGKITLKTEGIENIKGYQCYHISAQAFPNRFLRRIYDIEYKVDAYIDKKLLFTRRFEKVRIINKDYARIVIDFEQEKNRAIFSSEGSVPLFKISPERNKIEGKIPLTTKIPYKTQDLLSTFYYFRLSDIKADGSYPVNIYYNQRNWQMNIKVERPFLKDIRKIGSFPVVKISPDSLLNNYILGKRTLIVYMTVDSRRIPLEFKLDTALGQICAKIKNPS
jgi:hypothetical protein